MELISALRESAAEPNFIGMITSKFFRKTRFMRIVFPGLASEGSSKSKVWLMEWRTEMRTNYKFFAPLAVALLALCGVSGCGGSGSSNGPVSVSVSPSNPSVAVGSMQTFTANVTGGNSPATVTWSVMGAGTIDPSSGVYTAPMTVPTTSDIVTATSQGATGSATVNVTASQALQIAPGGPAIPAGMSQNFTVTAAGSPVGSVTWQVNGLAGGDCVAPANNATTPCHGTISSTGTYVAPLSPPPGGVTITALSGTDSGSTNPTVLYSSASLTSNSSTGQYAIQFAGSDFTVGFPLNVAGSIVTAGSPSSNSGTITGGEIDIASAAGVTQAAAITTGTYVVNPPDGRTTVTIATNANGNISSSFTLQLALTSNQHGLLIDVDSFGTGSGAIDAQNTTSFANSLNGNYSFSFSGLDPNLFPMFGAGTFVVNGGTIPINVPASPTNTQDLVDIQGFPLLNSNESVVTNDITLSGSLSTTIDTFGRGTIQMTSTSLGPINFAFYMIDQTHANMVETDTSTTTPLLFGQIFSAPNSATPLMGGIAFTAGGSSGGNSYRPYVIGGVVPLSGTSIGTGGLIDINTSSGSQVATGISSGSYDNSTATGNVPGRFTLSLTTSKSGSTPLLFAAYTTTVNTALLVEIDTHTDGSTGTAYQQSSPAPLVGSFATNLQGVGASKQAGPIEQDVSGQVVLGTNSGTPAVISGNLDLNSLTAAGTLSVVPSCTGNSSSCSTFTTPSNNRGTAVIKTVKNIATFNLTYYLVSPTTALYIDTDANRVASGIFLDQF
jgi:hypothetical protein